MLDTSTASTPFLARNEPWAVNSNPLTTMFLTPASIVIFLEIVAPSTLFSSFPANLALGPKIVKLEVVIVNASAYVPAKTLIVFPSSAAATAAAKLEKIVLPSTYVNPLITTFPPS